MVSPLPPLQMLKMRSFVLTLFVVNDHTSLINIQWFATPNEPKCLMCYVYNKDKYANTSRNPFASSNLMSNANQEQGLVLFLAGLILLKVFIFIYTTQVIFELVEAPVGRANVLHGLLEFAKLLRIVQNVAFSFCKHQIDVLHDILFEPIKSQKFRIEDFNVWIIGVEM